MNKIDEKRISKEFLREYRKHIALRIAGSVVLIAASVVLCTVLDFSGTKYPAMGVVLVLAAGAALACLVFKLHWILMKPSWMGTILEADASMKYKAFGDRGRPRLTSTVTIQIDRGDPKPYVEDIVELDRDENNIYQMEAPYKIGDTVVYFRGMKRFARLSIQGTEELFDPKFVCAFCGHINEERERCFRCGKILLK